MWVFSNFFLLLDRTALKVFVVVRRVSVFCLAVSIWLDFVLATFKIRSVVSFVQTARTLPVSREIWSSERIFAAALVSWRTAFRRARSFRVEIALFDVIVYIVLRKCVAESFDQHFIALAKRRSAKIVFGVADERSIAVDQIFLSENSVAVTRIAGRAVIHRRALVAFCVHLANGVDFVLRIALEREILIFAVRHAPASVAPPVQNVRPFETFVEVVEDVAKHSLKMNVSLSGVDGKCFE